jgi:hypothetical protein
MERITVFINKNMTRRENRENQQVDQTKQIMFVAVVIMLSLNEPDQNT